MNTNTNHNPNPNIYEQLNKISADVCNIMEEFNRVHAPHPRDVQRRAKKAAYQRAHQYDPDVMARVLQRKIDRHNNPTHKEKLPQENFQDKLRIGKLSEQAALQYLQQLGYIVTDISDTILDDGKFSPFDLLVTRNDTSMVVDVKLQNLRPFRINSYSLDSWNKYETSARKVVLFHHKNRFFLLDIDKIKSISVMDQFNPDVLCVSIRDTIEI